MMNNNSIEMLKRFRKAAGYQKKAIQALFPDMKNEHFEVIENEFKLMLIEAMGEMQKARKKRADHFKQAFAEAFVGGFACDFAEEDEDEVNDSDVETDESAVERCTGNSKRCNRTTGMKKDAERNCGNRKKSGAKKVTIS